MKSIQLDFIKKTKISSPVKLVGFSKKKFFSREKELLPQEKKEELLRKNPRLMIESIYYGNKVKRKDYLLNYVYTFDYKTGVYTCSDELDEHYQSTGKEIFCANFPHLIDVGIMGHCSHGQSGLCIKSGVQCYQNGLGIAKPNMSLDDFRRIAEECRDLVNQFALGGRGDPNEHENFEEILKICRANRIVPNYTTSGFHLTDKQIELSKRYCGAVAVSWYRSDYTLDAIHRLVKAGVKTNIHFVLNNDTIDEAIESLENDWFPKGINAVIFLTHKPVGLGEVSKCLKPNDPKVNRILELIRNKKHNFKIGVDGCFVVSMIRSDLNFNLNYLDTCEATRFTCYIDADMIMHPCSFDVRHQYTYDLKKGRIIDGWLSEPFKRVRDILKKGCPNCKYNASCHGGCFLHKEIVLCTEKED